MFHDQQDLYEVLRMTPLDIFKALQIKVDPDPFRDIISEFLENYNDGKNELIDKWVKSVLPQEMIDLIDPEDMGSFHVPSIWLKDHGYRVEESEDGWYLQFFKGDKIIDNKKFDLPENIKSICFAREKAFQNQLCKN